MFEDKGQKGAGLKSDSSFCDFIVFEADKEVMLQLVKK